MTFTRQDTTRKRGNFCSIVALLRAVFSSAPACAIATLRPRSLCGSPIPGIRPEYATSERRWMGPTHPPTGAPSPTTRRNRSRRTEHPSAPPATPRRLDVEEEEVGVVVVAVELKHPRACVLWRSPTSPSSSPAPMSPTTASRTSASARGRAGQRVRHATRAACSCGVGVSSHDATTFSPPPPAPFRARQYLSRISSGHSPVQLQKVERPTCIFAATVGSGRGRDDTAGARRGRCLSPSPAPGLHLKTAGNHRACGSKVESVRSVLRTSRGRWSVGLGATAAPSATKGTRAASRLATGARFVQVRSRRCWCAMYESGCNQDERAG
jgi:hypothetical protein